MDPSFEVLTRIQLNRKVGPVAKGWESRVLGALLSISQEDGGLYLGESWLLLTSFFLCLCQSLCKYISEKNVACTQVSLV